MEAQMVLLKTLADPTRMTMLKLLLHEELCVCELRELLGISQPAVSQHMARLKAAGLVTERKGGQWTYYRGDLKKVTTGLGELIAFIAADPATVPEMAGLEGRRQGLSREAMCGEGKGEKKR